MNTTAQLALNYFQSQGLTAAQAAGLVGNLTVESGLDPNAYNAGENAHGIAQWEGGRWPALQQFAAATGGAVNSLATQLAFVWSELTGPYSGVLARLRGASDPATAATIIQSGYEGSTVASLPARQAAATQLFTGAAGAGYVSGSDIVSGAAKFLGVPYVINGESPTGFDCSGLVQYVLRGLGINVPRTAAEQATAGVPVASLAQAQPGDLLFFNGGGSTIDHVGIYTGNNQMIAAPEPGDKVKQQAVYTTPTVIRRVLPAGGTTGAGIDALGNSGGNGGGLGSVLGTGLGVLLGPLGAVLGAGGSSVAGGITGTVIAWSLKLALIGVGGAIVVVGVYELIPREQIEAKAQQAASTLPPVIPV